MTVAELITQLQKQPSQNRVFIEISDTYDSELQSLSPSNDGTITWLSVEPTED